MLKKILLGIVVVLAVLAVVVAMQPPEFTISRSIKVAAPPEAVFEQVNDMHKFAVWNPWSKIDPNMTVTYGGPPIGKGSSYAWNGNNDIGEGKLTIVDSQPPSRVEMSLDFVRPFKSNCKTFFTIKPEGNETVVTWSMSGQKNFLAKAFHLVLDMDKMVGEEYDKGLGDMKTIVEAQAKPQ